jgi:endogenous inhibitor of DNA gyrase (YacG/DUF329 family)
MNEYIRLCPSCGKEIKYKNKSHRIRADIKNSICQECQQRKYQSIEKFIRNCPICGKEIKHKKKISYERSIKKNQSCLFCYSKIGEYENKINIRNCPTCDKKIIYSNKYKCNYANLKKSECRSCSKSGEKAPLYGRIGEKNHNFGKKLTDERKKLISFSNRGEKNHNFGKTPHNFGVPMTLEQKLKISETKKSKPNPRIGIPLSDECKQKLRLSKIERLKKCYGQLSPFYNPKACQYFNNLMEETNTYIQHAENGGEFYIRELGYWVDGYNKKNNIIYEFDEKHHFDVFDNLKNKDIRRQKEIEEFLNCKFIRIKYNEI